MMVKGGSTLEWLLAPPRSPADVVLKRLLKVSLQERKHASKQECTQQRINSGF